MMFMKSLFINTIVELYFNIEDKKVMDRLLF
jgi:hypothetical protein